MVRNFSDHVMAFLCESEVLISRVTQNDEYRRITGTWGLIACLLFVATFYQTFLILAFLFLLNAGCDTPKPKPAAPNATLILWNWPNYMTDEVLSDFTNETGIRIEQRIFGDVHQFALIVFRAGKAAVDQGAQVGLDGLGA